MTPGLDIGQVGLSLSLSLSFFLLASLHAFAKEGVLEGGPAQTEEQLVESHTHTLEQWSMIPRSFLFFLLPAVTKGCLMEVRSAHYPLTWGLNTTPL